MIQLEYAVGNLKWEPFSFGKISFLKALNIREKIDYNWFGYKKKTDIYIFIRII